MNNKKFIIFIVAVICLVLSGIYLVKKISELRSSPEIDLAEDSLYQEGVSKITEGDFDSATEILEDSLKEGEDPDKMKMLAISLYNQKDYDEAEKYFKKLLKIDEENKFLYYNSLANVYRDQKDFEKAIEYYEKSIEANNQFETAYQNLAVLYLYEIDPHEPEKAREVVGRGLENIPESEVLQKMK